MPRKITPDELIDSEIARLRNTEAVKMAEKEMRLIYRKRKYLAQLRWMEKRASSLWLTAGRWTRWNCCSRTSRKNNRNPDNQPTNRLKHNGKGVFL